jgi:DNA-binding XRE family transcriptional regulator
MAPFRPVPEIAGIWPEVSVPFSLLTNFADLLSSSLAILLSSLMEHRQQKTAPHRGSNDSAALAAQCARKLLELRTVTGKTQKQLAARLRMTESMISRLERGDHVPSLKTLCRIADAFGRHLEIVFHEHEHVHADGTRHIHPHSHYDPEHQHDHGGEK